jgi:hypothetical protein
VPQPTTLPRALSISTHETAVSDITSSELRHLYRSPNVRIIKARRTREEGHEVKTGTKRIQVRNILENNSEG